MQKSKMMFKWMIVLIRKINMKKLNFPNLSISLASKAWCDSRTSHKVMDVELAEVFSEILDEEMSKPNLGCATTRQLLDEVKARVDLDYSTVFYNSSVDHTK